jgi:ubiquitin-protein ligase
MDNMDGLRQQRLLRDIAELCDKPYPNIRLVVDDANLSESCLILWPDGYSNALHLKVAFGHQYPLQPPSISIQSRVSHPNVFHDYICASILNTEEGYTPAYTLKGIAIQILSFFSSDSIIQENGHRIDLRTYKQQTSMSIRGHHFKCDKCRFGHPNFHGRDETTQSASHEVQAPGTNDEAAPSGLHVVARLLKMPNIMLMILEEHLDFEDLIAFSKASEVVSQLIVKYDVIRRRELQCFCLKKNYLECTLGVGVAVNLNRGRQGFVLSEFDLISKTAFRDMRVRKSIHGVLFQIWLPIAITRRHWLQVKPDLDKALTEIQHRAQVPGPKVMVLLAFMNDIVVRLSQDLENQTSRNPQGAAFVTHSTLRHASEKAIDSYFHLFHLLLCMAVENDQIVRDANRLIDAFRKGATSKTACPNLGYLLIALLISDIHVTEQLMKDIITEAITRNVVWLLDKRGANMPELSFIEPEDEISNYRLQKTFEGSRTSYRLLMFSELFRRTARPSKEKKSEALRDELFNRHGAPECGTAARLAAEVRRLQGIGNFPDFLREMGIQPPTALLFSRLLRRTVRESVEKGYSSWGLRPEEAQVLRRRREHNMTESIYSSAHHRAIGPDDVEKKLMKGKVTFFPARS